MKLYKIMEREEINFKKLLLPSNTGFETMIPGPYHALGIPNREGDTFTVDDLKLEVVRLRAENIPQECDACTKSGVPVVGLTGDDLFDEYRLRNPDSNLRLVDTIDWIVKADENGQQPMYTRPTLCFIAPQGTEFGNFPPRARVRYNTKFERIAKLYLQDLAEEYGIDFDMQGMDGKIENVIPDTAEYGIDIVVTGNTLRYKDKATKTPRDPPLVVLKEIRQSDMSIITSWPSSKYVFAPDDPLYVQYQTILKRLQHPTDSYTSKLLSDDNNLLKKFGEESAEFLDAFSKANQDRMVEESQEVIWAVQMMIAKRGVPWEHVLKAIADAQKK